MFGRHHDETPQELAHGARGRAATSDLRGQEFWLLNDAGFQVVGLVLGNSVYSIGAIRNFHSGFKAKNWQRFPARRLIDPR